MEIAIPGIALSLLYFVNNQNKKNSENFTNKTNELPNTNIPNKNYPSEYPIVSGETDQTSKLSKVNKFDSPNGVFTDKYFSANGAVKIESSNSVLGNVNENALDSTPFYYSLTGEKVDSNYFQHNNMVPYFGSNSRSLQKNMNSGESILDNYVGGGSQIMIKKEVAPLFAPSENAHWAHGAPNNSEFYQSRVNPSMRMANVNPFEEKKVAPGLGLGYTTEGVGGFNSGMMARDKWLDKNVDQLRVDNNPKPGGFMLYGHEGPSTSYIKNFADVNQMGVMEKNRPERTFEILGNDKNYLTTTTGLVKGNTMRSIPTTMYKDTARQDTTKEYTGVAGHYNNGDYIPGEYMPSHNIQLGEVPIGTANASGRNYAHEGEFEKNGKFAYPNNRSVNKQDTYYGMVSGGLSAVVAPLLDILRPSRKENVVGTLRPYQNPGTTVPQSYIFNPSDKPGVTIRETTENSKFHLNVNRNQQGGAYKITEHQKINNNRETTDDFYYAGGASASDRTRQMKSYEAEYNQRNNDIKSSTIQGYTPSGNMKLLNNNVNYREVERENYFVNNRASVPTMPYQSADIKNMGDLQGQNKLYSNINMDRNDTSIHESLKGNPYVVNYKNGL